MDHGLLRKILQERLIESRARNSAYSVRAFASRLGIRHSALSEILNGKRNIGAKLGERLADALSLDPETRRKILKPIADSKLKNTLILEQLRSDEFHVVADWYHFAILSLAETDDFQSNPTWIAKRLGITHKTAQGAIQRLCRLKLLATEGGLLTVTGRSFSSTDEIPDAAVRSTHHQYLDLAHESLDRDAVTERDFVAITVAVDRAKLVEAKRRIRAFRNELASFLESGTKNEVFELSIQLFPLSKGDSD